MLRRTFCAGGLALGAGWLTAGDAEKPVVVDAKYDGRKLTLKLGQKLEFRLLNDEENAGWEGFELRGDNVLVFDVPKKLTTCDEFIPKDKSRPESTQGLYVTRFTATKVGKVTVRVLHLLPSGPKPVARKATKLIADLAVAVEVV